MDVPLALSIDVTAPAVSFYLCIEARERAGTVYLFATETETETVLYKDDALHYVCIAFCFETSGNALFV